MLDRHNPSLYLSSAGMGQDNSHEQPPHEKADGISIKGAASDVQPDVASFKGAAAKVCLIVSFSAHAVMNSR